MYILNKESINHQVKNKLMAYIDLKNIYLMLNENYRDVYFK